MDDESGASIDDEVPVVGTGELGVRETGMRLTNL